MKRKLALFSFLLILCLLLTACKSIIPSSKSATGDTYNTQAAETASGISNEITDSSEIVDTTSNSDLETRKLIKDVSMNIETKLFDDFMTNLQTEIDKNSGFVQSSNVTGNSYSSASNRNATVVARIPADSLEQFLNQISSIGNVTGKTENVKDVTMNYVDIESHIKALETEQESLLKLLESAKNLSDILSIQSRLTLVRSQLESYESQLRTYNDLISYSTVTMNIREVNRETTVKEGTWQQIGTNLSNNFKDIGNGFRSVFIWFVSALPYLFIIAAVMLIIVGGILIKIKKKKNKTKIVLTSPTDESNSKDNE